MRTFNLIAFIFLYYYSFSALSMDINLSDSQNINNFFEENEKHVALKNLDEEQLLFLKDQLCKIIKDGSLYITLKAIDLEVDNSDESDEDDNNDENDDDNKTLTTAQIIDHLNIENNKEKKNKTKLHYFIVNEFIKYFKQKLNFIQIDSSLIDVYLPYLLITCPNLDVLAIHSTDGTNKISLSGYFENNNGNMNVKKIELLNMNTEDVIDGIVIIQ